MIQQCATQYAPPFIELWGAVTPQFSNQIDAAGSATCEGRGGRVPNRPGKSFNEECMTDAVMDFYDATHTEDGILSMLLAA